MDERCRNCEAMLAEGAEWCNQCFTLVAPSEPKAVEASAPIQQSQPVSPPMTSPSVVPTDEAAPGEQQGVEPAAAGDHEVDPRLVWACPTCGQENPLSLTLCVVCGTPFGKLFDEEKKVGMDPSRAAVLGLLPGYAMLKMGEMAEGLSRAIAASLAVVTVFFFIGPGNWARLVILVLYAAFLVLLVVESSMSSRRLAEKGGVLISGRYLMYMFSVVFGASVLLVIMVSTTARQQ